MPSAKTPQEHTGFGVVDAQTPPDKKQQRAQAEAERRRKTVEEAHHHQDTESGQWHTHLHENEPPGHEHPARVFPATGQRDHGPLAPSVGWDKLPPPSAETIATLSAILGRPTPPSQLMRWRVRYFCGHVAERTVHIEQLHYPRHGDRCPECGLEPATAIAAEPLGPAAEPPSPLKPKPTKASKAAVIRGQIARLQAQLNTLSAEDG